MKRFVTGCFAAALAIVVQLCVAAENSEPKLTQPVADLAEARKALKSLDEFMRAYEAGNVNRLRTMLDPSLIGYQRLIDGMIQDTNRYKQIRLHLLNTQVLAGPDVAVIQADWQKRFLNVAGMRPGLFEGHSMFLMHREGDGWRMAAFSGDNPFSSQSGVLGQLTLTYLTGRAVPAIQIEVVDPDMAGRGTLNVTAGGINRVLTEGLPGQFSLTIPSPGLVPGDTFTLRYLDSNPGNGRPPSVLTRSLVVP
jgi:hypothetical protein